MKTFETPLKSKEVEKLRVGDSFQVTGEIFTARDAAHRKLLSDYEKGKELPLRLEDYPCFHCGPAMKKVDEKWEVVSAGPTTSIRMEVFEKEFMEKFGIKVFIGKGGMGGRTLDALREYGGVYAQFTGGAGSLAAESITEVGDVFYLNELGIPEAVWFFKVKKFGPLLVTMDSRGSSLHDQVSEKVSENLERLRKELTG